MDPLFGIILHLLALVQVGWAEYGDRIKNATVTWGDNLDMEESRHGGYAVAAPAPRTELPVTFQAPYINAQDFWSPPDQARRTGLDYARYGSPKPQDYPRPPNDPLSTFYGIMNQFFGTDEPPRRPPSPYRPPQFDYDYPYYQPPRPKPYYLPGPKPLRASVQKLEPPRAHYPTPVDHPTTPRTYPQFVKILNDVLIENAYHQEPPVLEKPGYEYQYNIVPTTYKPRFKIRKTAPPMVFPGSIQDQLPPITTGQDSRIPYVTETTTQAVRPTAGTNVVFPVETEQAPSLDYAIDVRNADRPIAKRPTPVPLAANSDQRSNHQTTSAPIELEITTNGESGVTTNAATESYEKVTTASPVIVYSETKETQQQLTTTPKALSEFVEIVTPSSVNEPENITESSTPQATTEPVTEQSLQTQPSEIRPVVTELLRTMEPLEHNRFRAPFPKKLHSRKVTTDATDYVTDLTLRGLTDANAIHASVPRYTNPFNMTSVIGYVLGRFNATAPPSSDPDDSLSLDAKILKDTNWDGIQPGIPTTEQTAESTTEPTTTSFPTTLVQTTVPTTVAQETTTTRIAVIYPVTRIATTTRVATTTEEMIATTFLPSTEATAPVEKQTAVIATHVTQTVSKPLRQRQRTRTTTEEPIVTPRRAVPTLQVEEITAYTTESTTPRRGRKYQRRPRVQSFTRAPEKPSTTEATVKFGKLTRPFSPQRSRPNVTLTRPIKRADISEEKKPTRVTSKEDLTIRRNLYKRRKYPSQIRRVTTDESAVDETKK